MSLTSNSIFAALANFLIMGNRECVAKAGASSVFVYAIVDVLVDIESFIFKSWF